MENTLEMRKKQSKAGQRWMNTGSNERSRKACRTGKTREDPDTSIMDGWGTINAKTNRVVKKNYSIRNNM